MKILRVGDPHIRPSNIEEADRLMTFVKDIVVGGKVDRLEILGDLFHTHAVIRLEVLEFWNKWLEIFSSLVETIVLVGNHDQSGDYNSRSHALRPFKRMQSGIETSDSYTKPKPGLRIIDSPVRIGIFLYAPYIHGESAFKDAVRGANDGPGAKILVCHQTFAGSQYDNGFYAPDGFNPDDLLEIFDLIISGHIHKEQVICNGRVDYPGTSKWDSASDANERKGIWLYEHDDITGKVLSRDMISTENVVTPIVSVVWNEGEEAPKLPENAKISLELVGSSAWIAKNKQGFKGKVSVKSKITDKEKSNLRKAGKGLEDFLLNVYSTNMNRNDLVQYARELKVV